MSLHQLPLLLGLVLLLAAAALLVLVDDHMPLVREPRVPSDEGAKDVRLDLPPIQNFAHYYGSEGDPWQDLNPFIPSDQREGERRHLERRRQQRNQRQNPVTSQPPQLPEPPRPQQPVPKPQLTPLPKLGASGIATPEVVGFLAGPNGRELKARFGDGPVVSLEPGDSHAGWTFIGVRSGTAYFLDAEGVEHGFFVSDPVSGVTSLGATDHLTGGAGAGGTAGQTGTSDQPAAGSDGTTTEDLGELLRQIQSDPRGAAMLQANPDLRRMLEQNPRRARRLFERLRER